MSKVDPRDRADGWWLVLQADDEPLGLLEASLIQA
jgi:hypothetical protein